MPSSELRPRVVAIIQARMASSRLPGKALADIAGRSLLERVIQGARSCSTIDEVVVATTWQSEDEAIQAEARRLATEVLRGSASDVLDRFFQAAWLSHAGVIVRFTADDPFKDPEVADRIVRRLLANPALDYVSNTLRPSFPEGLDIEAFRFRALRKGWDEASLPSDREHVTPFIWRQPRLFRVEQVINAEDLSHHRWTVDHPDDLEFARRVARHLPGYPGMREILRLLDRQPKLAEMQRRNRQRHPRNEGYLRSTFEESQQELVAL